VRYRAKGAFAGMADREQIKRWISEFQAAGEQAVRENIFRGGHLWSDEEKISIARTWLRDQERKREAQGIAAFNYIRWTLWAAVAAAVFAACTLVVVVVVLVLRL
jgi:hypothetical protein